jgi:peptidoglycan/LPS O-acetylase OafA/YrhL
MTRFPEIDGIRGILSLIVVAGHVIGIAHWPAVFADGESPLYWYWGCMEIFFCISGFLITRNLLHSSAQKDGWIGRYLAKRALRIWPAYYVALVAAILVSLYLPLPPSPQDLRWNGDWLYLLKALVFLQYTEFYWGGDHVGMVPVFGHSWSVALEEQFYILILLAIWLQTRTGLFAGLRALLLIAALLPLSQLMRHTGLSSWTLLGRAEGFLCGIALAYLEPGLRQIASWLQGKSLRARSLVSYSLCLTAPLFLLPYLLVHGYWEQAPQFLHVGPTNPYFAFSWMALLLLASIIVAPVTAMHALLRLPPLRYLGEISYSTYLFHIPVLFVVYSLCEKFEILGTMFPVLGPLAALATASLTYRFVEKPFLTLKGKLS